MFNNQKYCFMLNYLIVRGHVGSELMCITTGQSQLDDNTRSLKLEGSEYNVPFLLFITFIVLRYTAVCKRFFKLVFFVCK